VPFTVGQFALGLEGLALLRAGPFASDELLAARVAELAGIAGDLDNEVFARAAFGPPVDVLRGQVLGAIVGPLQSLLGLVSAPLQNLVGLIDARIEQLGGLEAPPPDAAPAAEAEPESPAEEPAAEAETPAPEAEAPDTDTETETETETEEG